ncbi:MAG: hypothetical protein WBE28_03975, partial [bacterium]
IIQGRINNIHHFIRNTPIHYYKSEITVVKGRNDQVISNFEMRITFASRIDYGDKNLDYTD